LSPERFGLQVTIGQETHDKLRYAQALLGHAVPTGDLAEVLDRALDALVTQLERQRFAKTSRPGRQRSSTDPRHVPASVKRAVWERDGGKCTFVAEDGDRCDSPRFLEFDHVDPVACGGEATVEGIRLRCRAHNQYEAECAFGPGFMAAKREAAKLAAAEARAKTAAERQAAADAHGKAAAEERERAETEKDPERSVIPWLRKLGYDLPDAREAAKLCEHVSDAPLEERIKAALRYSRPRTVSRTPAITGTGSESSTRSSSSRAAS
jgi:hypothetical protein